MLGIMFSGNVIGPFVFLPIRLRYLTPPIGYPVVFSCFSKTLFTSVADQCDFLAYLFSCQLHFLHVLKLAVVYIHATVALPWVLRYKAKADSAAQELKKKSIPLKKSENSNACTLSCKFMQIGLSLSLSSIILVGSLWSTKPLNWTNLIRVPTWSIKSEESETSYSENLSVLFKASGSRAPAFYTRVT